MASFQRHRGARQLLQFALATRPPPRPLCEAPKSDPSRPRLVHATSHTGKHPTPREARGRQEGRSYRSAGLHHSLLRVGQHHKQPVTSRNAVELLAPTHAAWFWSSPTAWHPPGWVHLVGSKHSSVVCMTCGTAWQDPKHRRPGEGHAHRWHDEGHAVTTVQPPQGRQELPGCWIVRW